VRKDAIAAEAASPKREALAAEIRRLGPWHHDIEVQGLSTYAASASERYDPAFGVPTRLDPFEHLSGLVAELYPGGLAGRAFLDCACNAGGYVLAARVVAALHRKETSLEGYAIRLGYAAAAASAILAGLMWRPEPLRTALEGFLTLGALPFALLSIARNAGRDGEEGVGARAVPRSWVWIAVCGAIFGVFLFVQARGLGSMATSRLSP